MSAVGVHGNSSHGVGVYGVGGAYDFYADGPGVNFGTSSSIRWKRNIKPLTNVLEKILQLRGVYFDWDDEHGGSHDLGMIAEEVGRIFPEIVSFELDGRYTTGMDYSKLTPILVEAIKQQQATIDQQKQELVDLRARMARLESALQLPEK